VICRGLFSFRERFWGAEADAFNPNPAQSKVGPQSIAKPVEKASSRRRKGLKHTDCPPFTVKNVKSPDRNAPTRTSTRYSA
jgi:hypothetical protein